MHSASRLLVLRGSRLRLRASEERLGSRITPLVTAPTIIPNLSRALSVPQRSIRKEYPYVSIREVRTAKGGRWNSERIWTRCWELRGMGEPRLDSRNQIPVWLIAMTAMGAVTASRNLYMRACGTAKSATCCCSYWYSSTLPSLVRFILCSAQCPGFHLRRLIDKERADTTSMPSHGHLSEAMGPALFADSLAVHLLFGVFSSSTAKCTSSLRRRP